MNKYIVLLRGINVGGRNKLPMADLRKLLTDNGYKDVSTYIQSGNILLTSDKNLAFINDDIKQLIKNQYDYEIPVLSLTKEELQKCISNNPYLKTEENIKNLHVTFLKDEPEKDLIENLHINKYKNDAYLIDCKTVYLHTPDGYGKTKFTNAQFEKKLNVQATTRNWKTTLKLFEMITS